MSVSDPCLIRSRGPSGQPVLRLAMPLVDDYLEFLEGTSMLHDPWGYVDVAHRLHSGIQESSGLHK